MTYCEQPPRTWRLIAGNRYGCHPEHFYDQPRRQKAIDITLDEVKLSDLIEQIWRGLNFEPNGNGRGEINETVLVWQNPQKINV